MKMASACIINGLHVIQVTINTHMGHVMEADYALVHREVNQKSGRLISDTHGKCTAGPTVWSKETLERLSALLDSMESDLVSRHFKGDGEGAEENARTFIGGHETPPQV